MTTARHPESTAKVGATALHRQRSYASKDSFHETSCDTFDHTTRERRVITKR